MKTALGCLIYFSAQNLGGSGHNGADLLSREPCIYQIIYSILEDPDSKPLMLEYVLRLINVTASQTVTALQNYLSGSLMPTLLNYLKSQNILVRQLSMQNLRLIV